MILIYIAGPFRAKTQWGVRDNIRRAEQRARDLITLTPAVPIIPHSMYASFDGTKSDRFWIEATGELLTLCDAVWLDGGWEASQGSRAERRLADELGIPCLFSMPEVASYCEEKSAQYLDGPGPYERYGIEI